MKLTPLEKERLSTRTKDLHIFLEDIDPDNFKYMMHVQIYMQPLSIHFSNTLDLDYLRATENKDRQQALDKVKESIDNSVKHCLQCYALTIPRKLDKLSQQLTGDKKG